MKNFTQPEMGPISTGLGEVFHYVLSTDNPDRSLTDLREIHDWVVKPEMLKVRGTAEINSWGGFEKQFQVIVDPGRLIKFGTTIDHVITALEKNNQSTGGGAMRTAGMVERRPSASSMPMGNEATIPVMATTSVTNRPPQSDVSTATSPKEKSTRK